MSPVCAAPSCANPVVRRPGQTGRPAIYCSPACRPSYRRPALTVDVDHDPSEGSQPGRDWVVRLRRGPHAVILRQGLGRFSATALATELRSLLAAEIRDTTP
jgi:hypothetical protein